LSAKLFSHRFNLLPASGLLRIARPFDFHYNLRYSGSEQNHARWHFCRRAFFFGSQKMTDLEILTLVDRFERCLLDKAEFHHRDHLTVSVAYLYAGDLAYALGRMRASLTRFATHHGVPGLYHETLTRFWLQQVEQRLDRSLCLAESVRKVHEQLSNKDLPFDYYSRETLNSPQARAKWIEPDRVGVVDEI
jgi:hypothetical protein